MALGGSNHKSTITFVGVDHVSATVKKVQRNMAGLGGPKFGPIGNLIGGFSGIVSPGLLAAGAITAVAAALLDGVKNAADDEASLAKLDEALKTNVTNWDGNRQSIDNVIEARQRLGFTDDDLRDSLSQLVTRSGDVDQALKDQGLAMDYARLKGISLEDATRTVIGALEGNTKAMKNLGIEIDPTASELDRFKAIQEKVNGQAEAFGKTTQGSFDAAGVAIGELSETIGSLIAGPMKDLAQGFTDMLLPIADSGGAIGQLEQHYRDLADAAALAHQETTGETEAVQSGDQTWIGRVAVMEHMDDLFGMLGQHTGEWSNKLQGLGDTIGLKGHDLEHFVQLGIDAGQTYDELADQLGRVAQAMADLPGWEQKAGLGRWQATHNPDGSPRAAGGPVMAGTQYTVGEHGPEQFVPSQNGTIIPNGGSGGHGHDIYMDGEMVGRLLDQRNGKALALF